MSANEKTDLDLDALAADVVHLVSDGADPSGDLDAFHRLLAAAPALIAAARERAEDVDARILRIANRYKAERDAARDEVAALRERVEALAAAHDNENWRAWGIPQAIRAALTTGGDA